MRIKVLKKVGEGKKKRRRYSPSGNKECEREREREEKEKDRRVYSDIIESTRKLKKKEVKNQKKEEKF